VSVCLYWWRLLLYPVLPETAQAATKRALAAGITSPLIYFADLPPKTASWSFSGQEEYARFLEVTLLGALEASFDPIDVREHYQRQGKEAEYRTLSKIGVVLPKEWKGEEAEKVIELVSAVEEGRRVAKGKCGGLVEGRVYRFDDPQSVAHDRWMGYLIHIETAR
jgi:hypothetical protein